MSLSKQGEAETSSDDNNNNNEKESQNDSGRRSNTATDSGASSSTSITLSGIADSTKILGTGALHALFDPPTALRAFLPPDSLPSMFFSKQFNPATDIPDLSGKVFFVTGGNTGLGAETIAQLAAHQPAHIYLAARSEPKAAAAIATIKKAHPTAAITHIPLDLASFDSIRAAADTFTAASDRLDVLINNAGIMAAAPGSTTKDGYELQLGTNHLGHFLLTRLLLPTMRRTATLQKAQEKAGSSTAPDVRIVTLSSSAYQMAPWSGITLEPTSLGALSPYRAYGNSKLANLLFAREAAQRFAIGEPKDSNGAGSITSVAVHPGVILTELWDAKQGGHFAALRWTVGAVGRWVMADVSQGARTQLWAATAPKDKIVNGGFYVPTGSLSAPMFSGGHAEQAKRLWDWSEEQVKSRGF